MLRGVDFALLVKLGNVPNYEDGDAAEVWQRKQMPGADWGLFLTWRSAPPSTLNLQWMLGRSGAHLA